MKEHHVFVNVTSRLEVCEVQISDALADAAPKQALTPPPPAPERRGPKPAERKRTEARATA